MKLLSVDLEDYLQNSTYIDWKDTEILKKASDLKAKSIDNVDYVKRAYEFVRDEIEHSFDAQDSRITIKASEVLCEKVGICWAKSNLLAALLRANNIPAGICYQKLTCGDTPQEGYCLHALNAVFFQDLDKWIRLDARGNKEGVCAQFSLDEEILAFSIRKEYGEIDYDEIYSEPADITIKVLQRNNDALYMYAHDLPEHF